MFLAAIMMLSDGENSGDNVDEKETNSSAQLEENMADLLKEEEKKNNISSDKQQEDSSDVKDQNGRIFNL